SADAYQLYARLRDRARSPLHLIAERMNRAPEVVQLQTQDHVRIGDDLAPPLRLVERVLCWEIQATDLVDDRCLKRFGEFDEKCHACRSASRPVGNQYRTLCGDEQAGCFRNCTRISLGRRCQIETGYVELGVVWNRVFLQLAVRDQEDR